MLQIGARNMQNFVLLKAVGRSNKPVLLKRGAGATVKEWLCAAEYILLEGNDQVVLCERGSKGLETATRNTLDLQAALLAKQWSHLPVFVDPSHASGRTELIAPLCRAAKAAGLDGVIVEMHPCREEARCDKDQALRPSDLAEIVNSLD
jgi:3-deoxy-7-phosphoheptulonate synthase